MPSALVLACQFAIESICRLVVIKRTAFQTVLFLSFHLHLYSDQLAEASVGRLVRCWTPIGGFGCLLLPKKAPASTEPSLGSVPYSTSECTPSNWPSIVNPLRGNRSVAELCQAEAQVGIFAMAAQLLLPTGLSLSLSLPLQTRKSII